MSLSGRQQYPPSVHKWILLYVYVVNLVKTGVSSLIKSFGVHDSKESNTLVHSEQIQVREQMSQHLWRTDGCCSYLRWTVVVS